MSRIKKFLSLTVLMIGVLWGALPLTHFSFSQNFGPIGENMFARTFTFKMPNNQVYLYAITEPNTYTIYFDGNGNTAGNMGSMTMTYDKEENLLKNNFTREGYTFKGWSSTKTGIVEYSDQSEVKNLTSENLGEVTLYAQRVGADVPYTVEYFLENTEGGYNSIGTGTEYGPEGPGLIITGQTFTGFTLQTGAAINIISGGIVPYYYTRKIYNLTVIDRDRYQVLIDTGVKYGVNIIPLLPESLTGWTGNTFEGWSNIPEDSLMPANDLEISAVRTIGLHSISFDTDGGNDIPPIVGNYGDLITIPPNPIKPGYEFMGWDQEIPTTITKDDINVKAIWKEVGEQQWGGWSGGGRYSGKSQGEGEGEHGSAVGQSVESIDKNKSSIEVLIAYTWANGRGIVDTSRKNSDPDGYVTRGDIAEMLVKFTENVIGKKTPTPIPTYCTWGDDESDWKSSITKMYAEKACALGVMGIRTPDFMPNKVLDRAEFGTILSRLLWGNQYDVVDVSETRPYYIRHLAALQREGVVKQINNPFDQKELRKWAWLMLMRIESKIL